jgi:hypothetical protein
MLAESGDLLQNSAIVLGCLSIVALVHARQAWKVFKASLADAATHDTGDIPYLREWDFRYWRCIGLWTAGDFDSLLRRGAPILGSSWPVLPESRRSWPV